MTKLISFFLPQFHSIPENDEWWGKGFTEWINVKNAKPQFSGHQQPRVPLGNNYYNLTDPETRLWQASLAKKFGIYGFCYYHYWFNGRKLLEKPVEGMLSLQQPEFPFCLAWANEPWTRAWDGKKSQVLMAQEYGKEEDWQNHFNYLLPFFQDDRYIRIDEKPLFVLYRTSSIQNCDQMLRYWQQLATKNKLNGLYFAEMVNSFQNKGQCAETQAVIEFEPLYTLAYDFNLIERLKRKFSVLSNKKSHCLLDYDLVWQKIISRKKRPSNKTLFGGAFVDWDNSPRRSSGATIMKGSSPEKFKNYLSLQIKRSKAFYQSGYLFINAWNEWAEGAYLEPDEQNGNQYLKSVKQALEENRDS